MGSRGNAPGGWKFSGSVFVALQAKIFTIPFSARLGGFDDEPLRQFLAGSQVHALESWHFVHEGTPFWSVLLTYTLREAASGENAPAARAAENEKGNWRKRLGEADWGVFNALREWRKQRAEQEGIPPYLVFTNEQLTQAIVCRATSLAALGQINGIGPSRIEKYGKDVLRILDGRDGSSEERGAGASGLDGLDGVPGVAAADNPEVPEVGAVHADDADRHPGAGRGDDAD
jgi:hypothetical protein